MRTREEVNKKCTENSCFDQDISQKRNSALILEVLLDIREALSKEEEINYVNVNNPEDKGKLNVKFKDLPELPEEMGSYSAGEVRNTIDAIIRYLKARA